MRSVLPTPPDLITSRYWQSRSGRAPNPALIRPAAQASTKLPPYNLQLAVDCSQHHYGGLPPPSRRVLQATCIASLQSDLPQSRAWPSLHRSLRSPHGHRKQCLPRQGRPPPLCLRRQRQHPSRHQFPSLHRNVHRNARRSPMPTARFPSPPTTPVSTRSCVKSPAIPASKSQVASQRSVSSDITAQTAQLRF